MPVQRPSVGANSFAQQHHRESEFIRDGIPAHAQPCAGWGPFAAKAAPTEGYLRGYASLCWASLRSAPTYGTVPL